MLKMQTYINQLDSSKFERENFLKLKLSIAKSIESLSRSLITNMLKDAT